MTMEPGEASAKSGQHQPFIGRSRLAGQPPRPGRYRHYKGQYYEVIETALHSETLEAFVVYRALYGERNLWVRPRSLFLSTVDVNGVAHPRFAPVDSPAEGDG
jgi:hypothetical protein